MIMLIIKRNLKVKNEKDKYLAGSIINFRCPEMPIALNQELISLSCFAPNGEENCLK